MKKRYDLENITSCIQTVFERHEKLQINLGSKRAQHVLLLDILKELKKLDPLSVEEVLASDEQLELKLDPS